MSLLCFEAVLGIGLRTAITESTSTVPSLSGTRKNKGCVKYVSDFKNCLVEAISYHLTKSSKERAYILNIRCEMLLATAS